VSPGTNYLLLLAYHRQGFDAKGDRPVDCCLKGQIDPLSGFSFCLFLYPPLFVFFQLVLVEEEGAENFDYGRKEKSAAISPQLGQ
jgi:hypothetical protein